MINFSLGDFSVVEFRNNLNTLTIDLLIQIITDIAININIRRF